ncbi:hypothetical protein EDD27_3336 [Nonomuraea polychroma]|uniref:Alpha amylase inhibitor n=1 Tax=Nonomuraea polychroma TaxID=46176 RepID=A0A438M506_9ACTN|nr:hypothetical protein [Nonomuraea polychroma]RVX40895.1 hypothetical protein EDD27_3336 [Nonomuraea polychroma]
MKGTSCLPRTLLRTSVAAAVAAALAGSLAAAPAEATATTATTAAAAAGPRCARVDHWVHWFDQSVRITNNCRYTVSAVVRHANGPDSPCYIIRPGNSRKYTWPRFRQAFQGIRWDCA